MYKKLLGQKFEFPFFKKGINKPAILKFKYILIKSLYVSFNIFY